MVKSNKPPARQQAHDTKAADIKAHDIKAHDIKAHDIKTAPTSRHEKPSVRPHNPNFSSGPCTKRPGWDGQYIQTALCGRSHRSKPAKARLAEAITRTAQLLQIPPDYRLAIVPGSDTGAFEMAMWQVLGARGLDILGWESFSKDWITDAVEHLKLPDIRVMEADYGELVNLQQVDFTRDVVFTWNGTTSGVRVPNGDWIAKERAGLTLCDATSAVFAVALPWDRLDITSFSWQQVMGGEAAHGMLVLSPRAVERLETYTPAWPLPKLFRLTKGGKLIDGLFAGDTINTPSMLAVEDYLDALNWAEQIGGLDALIARCNNNLQVLIDWVAKRDWVDFLCADPANLSNSSVCLTINHMATQKTPTAPANYVAQIAKRITALLDKEGVAYDIGSYRDAPSGLRIWTGATVEADDLTKLTAWLDWAYAVACAELAK